MIKQYLKNNKISMYKLSQESGVPYSTLNDLVNHKLPVENMKSGQLNALAKVLELSMDDFYQLCLYSYSVYSEEYKISGNVIVKHKSYYLIFERNGKHYEEEIIAAKQEATRLIDVLAKWKLEECLASLAMEEAYEAIYSEKKR